MLWVHRCRELYHPRPRAHVGESPMAYSPFTSKSWRFDTPMGHWWFPLGSRGQALGRIFSCSAPMWSADLYRLVTRRGMFRDNLTTWVWAKMIKAIVRTKSKIIDLLTWLGSMPLNPKICFFFHSKKKCAYDHHDTHTTNKKWCSCQRQKQRNGAVWKKPSCFCSIICFSLNGLFCNATQRNQRTFPAGWGDLAWAGLLWWRL